MAGCISEWRQEMEKTNAAEAKERFKAEEALDSRTDAPAAQRAMIARQMLAESGPGRQIFGRDFSPSLGQKWDVMSADDLRAPVSSRDAGILLRYDSNREASRSDDAIAEDS